ncbi:retinoid-inducible serine carboxypeptidase-like [Odontomachus brunneus]|uniref:retinoid-inducible serine carboxypeptidase-like n=1 Tax=Odontomachus brunneus TaxID=486640 RepID=UPI0013F1AC14|nr:retinoid-inducible serine carboxypeptidase-like [Odontomachus brunneus]
MQSLLFRTFAILCLVSGSIGREGFGPGEQEWGFVKVRPSANMFWWLYYTTADVKTYHDKPLVIWLQGGPGASSTSFGNFEELGPLDPKLNPRNYTWVKDYNVLFIDNPVGAGYSHVESMSAFVKTNAQIASDLVECMRGFYKQLPSFQNISTYITTESYGGKMGAEFALAWYRAQKAGTIKSNLKGVALGDAWISPIDSVMTWAPFLLSMGIIDTESYKEIDEAAKETESKVKTNQWAMATQYYAYTQNIILQKTYDVDFYNVLTKKTFESFSHYWFPDTKPLDKSLTNEEATGRSDSKMETFSLDKLMNGPVKTALDLQVTHGVQSYLVFFYLKEDFMKPATRQVEMLLDETDLRVFVYTGQLDLIVDTPGTLQWVEKLKWKKANTWKNAVRYPLVVNDIIEGYVKSQDKFSVYWINRAGHMVPKDNPAAMKGILFDLTNELELPTV